MQQRNIGEVKNVFPPNLKSTNSLITSIEMSRKHAKRFLVSTLKSYNSSQHDIRIEGKDYNHLKASRVKTGEIVELFNKEGMFISAKVVSVDKKVCHLVKVDQDHVGLPPDNDATPAIQKTLAVGMPKGSRSDWLVEKATELGVYQIIPLETRNSVLEVQESKMERWNRLILQAATQSRCTNIPILRKSISIQDLIKDEIPHHDMCLWGCMPHESDFKPKTILSLPFMPKPKKVLLVVGPEGDLTNQEKESLAENNCIPVVLSKNTLRVETASMIMLSSVDSKWSLGDFV